jgi:hypothetical protein
MFTIRQGVCHAFLWNHKRNPDMSQVLSCCRARQETTHEQSTSLSDRCRPIDAWVKQSDWTSARGLQLSKDFPGMGVSEE